jgi:hypothetical protein
MLQGVNMRAFAAGAITVGGNYAIINAPFPAVIDNATCVIRVGASAITAGVGAWLLLADDGTYVTLVTPAFGAINALTANSNNLFQFPGSGFGGAPIAGLGFAITTAITGGPITRITLTASLR